MYHVYVETGAVIKLINKAVSTLIEQSFDNNNCSFYF